jgi:hypothetical protein
VSLSAIYIPVQEITSNTPLSQNFSHPGGPTLLPGLESAGEPDDFDDFDREGVPMNPKVCHFPPGLRSCAFYSATLAFKKKRIPIYVRNNVIDSSMHIEGSSAEASE